MPKLDQQIPEKGTNSREAVAAVPAPSVRLATGVGPPDAFEKGMQLPADHPPTGNTPTVRLAGKFCEGNHGPLGDPVKGSPTVRLAHSHGAQGDNVLIGQKGVAALPDTSLPALLVSFYYLKQFMDNRHRYHYRDWVIDSGAFSAHNSGAEIDLVEYMDCCKQLMAEDPTLSEIYALDVIGDWKGSIKNTQIMWDNGIPAIPCYHFKEPWSVLTGIAKDYPKIALGGVAVKKGGKLDWAAQCFARVWPKKIHGFAFGSEKAIMSLPFHSTDATNWEIGPCRFGRWASFGGQQVSVRGSSQNLRAEVEWYLDLERRARDRWKKEMLVLEETSPTVRLAYSTGSGGEISPRTFERIAPKSPEVRLAIGSEGDSGGSQRAGQVAHALAPSVRLAQGGSLQDTDEVRQKRHTAALAAPSVRLVAESECTTRDEAKAEAFRPRKDK